MARAGLNFWEIYLERAPYDNNALSRSHPPSSRSMGVLAEISGPIGNFTANSSTPVTIAAGFAAFLVLAVVLNVLQQLLLKNPNEPPVVFHLFPIIGSTVTYGMDPYKFFFAQQKKVCRVPNGHEGNTLTGGSMAMYSPSFFSVAR